MELFQRLKDFRNVLAMFSHALGVHKYVDVYQSEKVKVLPKHLTHEFLEYGGTVQRDAVHVGVTKTVFHSSPSRFRMRL